MLNTNYYQELGMLPFTVKQFYGVFRRSFIGGQAAFLLNVSQDFGLLVAGGVGIVPIVRSN